MTYSNIRDFKIDIFDNLEQAAPVWQSLHNCPTVYAFQHFGWLKTWSQTLGNKTRLQIVAVSDQKGLAIIFPLCVMLRRKLRILTFMGHGVCDYNAPLMRPGLSANLSPGIFKKLWRKILAKIPDKDIFEFSRVPKFLANQELNPMTHLSCLPHYQYGNLSFLSKDWEGYCDMHQISKKKQGNFRRKNRNIGTYGKLEFYQACTRDDINNLWGFILKNKGKWLKDRKLDNFLAQPEYQNFYQTILQDFYSGLIHASIFKVGQEIIAGHIGLIHGNKFYYILPAYSTQGDIASKIQRYSPGSQLFHFLMIEAMQKGLKTFDMTIGNENYKQRWLDKKLILFRHISLYNISGVHYWIKKWSRATLAQLYIFIKKLKNEY